MANATIIERLHRLHNSVRFISRLNSARLLDIGQLGQIAMLLVD